MIQESFQAELEITLTREGLLDLLAKAGYSFPIYKETMIIVGANNGKDRVSIGPEDSEISIRLENQQP